MFRSVRSRLIGLFTLVVTLTVVAVTILSASLLRQSAEEQIRGELSRQAIALADLYSLQAENAASEDRPSPRFAPDRLRRLAGAQIYYSGLPLFPGDESDLPAPENLNVPLRRLSVNAARPFEWSEGDDEQLIGYAAPVTLAGQKVGALVVARERSELTAQWRPLATQVAVLLGVAWLLALVVALTLSRRITSPLDQLARVARQITLGRYTSPQLDALAGDDEIGQLASAFRDMTQRLHEVDAHDRRFLMSISHELRTPLTAIDGHAQALEEGLADDAESRERSLAVIRREAGRLERLVDDIIDLARLRSNRFNTVTEQVNLPELGDHLLAIFEDRPSHADAELRGSFDDIEFSSDGQRILQILRNLTNNALRYATTEVVVTGRRAGNSVTLTVYNDGEGVPEKMQEKIFDPFVGSKREGGMGLGLAIGRELSWALGGNLRYVPTDGGATFELTLPLEPPGSGR